MWPTTSELEVHSNLLKLTEVSCLLQKAKTTSNNNVCTSLQQKAMCACMLVVAATNQAYSTLEGHIES